MTNLKKKYTFCGADVFGITPKARARPSIYQCWFLHLKCLRDHLNDEVLKLPKNTNKILLDAGSGDAPPYHDLFKEKIGRIITLDPFAPTADINASIEDVPFQSEYFDYVLATQVFEHVDNPFDAAKEIARILKKNGRAFISTHGIWDIHGAPKDCWRFMPDSFLELFKNFKEVKIIPNGGTFFCLGQIINIVISPLFKFIFKLPIMCIWGAINILSLFFDKIFPNDKRFVINYLIVLIK